MAVLWCIDKQVTLVFIVRDTHAGAAVAVELGSVTCMCERSSNVTGPPGVASLQATQPWRVMCVQMHGVSNAVSISLHLPRYSLHDLSSQEKTSHFPEASSVSWFGPRCTGCALAAARGSYHCWGLSGAPQAWVVSLGVPSPVAGTPPHAGSRYSRRCQFADS